LANILSYSALLSSALVGTEMLLSWGDVGLFHLDTQST